MSAESNLRSFVIDELPRHLIELSSNFDPLRDPEVEWNVFRQFLKKLKKQHVELYKEYLESDDDSELSETEKAEYKRKTYLITGGL